MNPYYYLFYKISRGLNKRGNNEWGVLFALSFLISINIIVIYVNIFHVTRQNFADGYKVGLIIIWVFLFITNYILFFHKDKYKQIVKRYEKETLRSKRIGNFLVITYILVTFLAIFFA